MERLRFPGVRFGGTSWVVHDGFAGNLRELSRDVDDMQLVLFDNAYGSNIPSKDEVRALAELKLELGMSCTVHFAENVCMSLDASERRRCEDSCLRIMELFDCLNPYAYVLHLCGERYGTVPSADMERWRELTAGSAGRIAGAAHDRKLICAETLDFNFGYLWPVIAETGISACIDVGHLVMYGYPVEELLTKYLSATRVLHIHGVKPDGVDHSAMTYFDKGLLSRVLKILASDGGERIMTIEVFEDDYGTSVDFLRKFASEMAKEDLHA